MLRPPLFRATPALRGGCAMSFSRNSSRSFTDPRVGGSVRRRSPLVANGLRCHAHISERERKRYTRQFSRPYSGLSLASPGTSFPQRRPARRATRGGAVTMSGTSDRGGRRIHNDAVRRDRTRLLHKVYGLQVLPWRGGVGRVELGPPGAVCEGARWRGRNRTSARPAAGSANASTTAQRRPSGSALCAPAHA